MPEREIAVLDRALDIRPTSDHIELEFARIADSPILSTAPLMRSLLIYLWNHRGENISEYAVAVEALGRRPDFNCRIDASARVQIARLRSKLRRFYEAEGDSFPLRLSIPKGGHELKWVYHPPPPITIPVEPRGYSRRVLLSVVCAGLALAVLCLFLVLQNRRLQASIRESPRTVPRFWQTFLRGAKPTTIVVPTPVNFRWRDETELWVRDSMVSDDFDWSKSPRLLELAKRWGPPVPDEKYVVVKHMLAAVMLVQYLTQQNAPVRLGVFPRLGIDSSRDQNTIVIGGPLNTTRFHPLLSNFEIEAPPGAPALIRNRHPKVGEPSQFGELIQSDDRITFSGIIALLPRSHEGTSSLLLIGRNPTALVSMLMSAEGLRRLEDRWNQEGQPDAWEMVVQAEMDRDTVLNIRPVGFRPMSR